MASIEDGKRWYCPSDRELALRAKLNIGWSVHTHDNFRKPPVILAQELRSIEVVLERANAMDLLEKERIDKLVCRMENMRRNAVGDGTRSCFMCGDRFGFCKDLPTYCADCGKAVCCKCRIDIRISTQEVFLFCKICSENREVWKKSGGWFYGEVPAAVNCSKAFNTWEHTKQDIVRLESFKPPEENYIDVSLYKNWAANSSPDLAVLDEDDHTLKSKKERRKNSVSSEEELEMSHLSLPKSLSHLSRSCPSLSPQENVPTSSISPKQGRRKKLSSSRNRAFLPGRRVIGKITTRSRH